MHVHACVATAIEIIRTLQSYVWASFASISLLRVVTSCSRFVNELSEEMRLCTSSQLETSSLID